MGTIVGRTRKDGSKAFVAQIVIKKGGVIMHREADKPRMLGSSNAKVSLSALGGSSKKKIRFCLL